MYKEALQLGVRLTTPKGLLSIEQAFTLNMKDLEDSLRTANDKLKGSEDDDSLSFLDSTKTVNRVDQLAFDILKDIYVTKRAKLDDAKEAKSVKEHNETILALIKQKEMENLGNLSAEELRKKLK